MVVGQGPHEQKTLSVTRNTVIKRDGRSTRVLPPAPPTPPTGFACPESVIFIRGTQILDIFGGFSNIYVRGLGLRVIFWVMVSVTVWVRVSVVLWSG